MKEEMKKFENVARYLDGEDLQLNDEERALLEEFLCDESAMAERLSPDYHPELTKFVNDKIHTSLGASPSRVQKISLFRWTAAAAAAILIITAMVVWQTSDSHDSKSVGTGGTVANVQSANDLNTSDPSEDDIDEFLTPLFYDENAQAIINNGISEQDFIEVYYEDGDNVMLVPASSSRA